MDIRSVSSGTARVLAARLNEFNNRHPWSHNDHFHPWIVRRLPPRHRSALDVGCGRGELVQRLAGIFDTVDGIDRDGGMCGQASARAAAGRTVRIRQLPFGEVSDRYDAITMVAVLHHLDLRSALSRIPALLHPGGRLLVVGLARPHSATDLLFDLVSAVANPVVGMVKHPRAVRGAAAPPPFPVADPVLTFEQIGVLARQLLPGARLRRRLFFRFTLEWTRPDLAR